MESQRAAVNPGSTSEVIKKYGIRAKKKYGQNFLIDENVLRKIVEGAGITGSDTVIEIGPGTGSLTRHLSDAAGKVYAFEIDEKLLPVLSDTLKDRDNVTVINKDILKVDLNEFISETGIEGDVKVVANLPYYITSPVVMMLLTSGAPIENITIMIQKEVAQRMIAPPGNKTYGSLSLAVNYHSVPKVIMEVPPSCFIPRPKVSSTVIRLDIRERPAITVKDEGMLFSVIRASFNQRRKTLFNGLKNSGNLRVSADKIKEAIEGIGKPASVRGEQLSLEEFGKLSDLLYE